MPGQGNTDLVFAAQVAGSSEATLPERRQGARIIFSGPLRVRRAGEKEALLLSLICAIDMYTTLWWVIRGVAREANPLLAWTFAHHPILFVAVKCLTCLPPLLILTNLAQKRPIFTVFVLRVAIVAYIALYLTSVNW